VEIGEVRRGDVEEEEACSWAVVVEEAGDVVDKLHH
jgi:hypothetical protein